MRVIIHVECLEEHNDWEVQFGCVDKSPFMMSLIQETLQVFINMMILSRAKNNSK